MILVKAIETPRLRLRTLTPDDASERYLHWMTTAATNRFLESRFTQHSIESLRGFIHAMNDSPCELLLGLVELTSDVHVGNLKIGPIDRHHGHAAVGLVLDPQTWGQGYATEAIAAASNHAFSSLGLEKLFAGCYATNAGSIRAFEKAGFIREARLSSHWRDDEVGRVDGVILGLIGPPR